MNTSIKYRGRRGFTLIELLVVISIIGLLSSVILAALTTAKTRAIDARIASERHGMQNAIALFYTNKGYYPNPGDVGTPYCIAQQPCIYNDQTLNPLAGQDFAMAPAQGGLAVRLAEAASFVVGIAQASYLGGIISSYPHNTPVVTINGHKYSGPFYECDVKDAFQHCTSATMLWTTPSGSCDVGGVADGLADSGGALCETGAAGLSSGSSGGHTGSL